MLRGEESVQQPGWDGQHHQRQNGHDQQGRDMPCRTEVFLPAHNCRELTEVFMQMHPFRRPGPTGLFGVDRVLAERTV